MAYKIQMLPKGSKLPQVHIPPVILVLYFLWPDNPLLGKLGVYFVGHLVLVLIFHMTGHEQGTHRMTGNGNVSNIIQMCKINTSFYLAFSH